MARTRCGDAPGDRRRQLRGPGRATRFLLPPGTFSALLFVVALLGYLPVHDALTELLAMLGAVAPRELITLLYASAEGLRGADTEDYEAVAFIDCCKM